MASCEFDLEVEVIAYVDVLVDFDPEPCGTSFGENHAARAMPEQ